MTAYRFCAQSLLLLAMSGCFAPAFASLIVVGDLGGQSTAPFFDAIDADPRNVHHVGADIEVSLPASLSVANSIPVSTPELTPGDVVPRRLALAGMQPLFVVGDDMLSEQWLKCNASRLKGMGATGVIVNVASESALSRLISLSSGTEMLPMPGGDLARRLQLTHYPLLITSEGVFP
ncbi:MAG TPA: integrating conjugative element protein [Scandinavium sp.]|jgi:integrating conjugative element protein (TIGR03765 family)